MALARKILEIHALTDLGRGVTTNVAPIWGGTRPNVIPPEAGCRIDFRVPSLAEGERIVAAIRAMAGTPEEGISIAIEGGMNRPPFPETPATLALYEAARGFASANGYDLPKQHRGGGSDGNFTAVMGIPTLDGLGCAGAGAHAPEEHIRWAELAPRCATLCDLLETL
ncbi:M20/M25/M40 family metallo-hydrolase [Siccirubricoccus sp. G192]|uniref:M20/M25/M40 family metallo-hydrolase n=1 Tax=Siccirubricoccus sp. G192 TaxID=2849651 RepID=UPI0028114043|nr:M20/M25/M40 family metallo-hydrolase [Siccirubricoccus sp. G192]